MQKEFFDAGQPVYCIYVAIGQKASTVAAIAKTLEDRGAMAYTTIVPLLILRKKKKAIIKIIMTSLQKTTSLIKLRIIHITQNIQNQLNICISKTCKVRLLVKVKSIFIILNALTMMGVFVAIFKNLVKKRVLETVINTIRITRE